MTATLLRQRFQMNHWAAHANLQGISHDESLVHPEPAGNCLNWVLGHVVATRNGVLTTRQWTRIAGFVATAPEAQLRGVVELPRTAGDPPAPWAMSVAAMVLGSCWHARYHLARLEHL